MITFRPDKELEDALNKAAKNEGITKSELIRKSIIEYIGKLEKPGAWELGKDLFGKYSSGCGNLSEDRKEILKKKIKAKKG